MYLILLTRLIYEPLSNVLWCLIPKAGSSSYYVTLQEVAKRVMPLFLLLFFLILKIIRVSDLPAKPPRNAGTVAKECYQG